MFFVPSFETIISAGGALSELAMVPLTRYFEVDFKFVNNWICWFAGDGLFPNATEVATLV